MYLRTLVFFISILIILQSIAGHAATEVPGRSMITAVTVFPDRAEVVRGIEVSLPAGKSTVIVEGLPASLIARSVRVRGEADGTLLIGSVETKRHFAEDLVRAEERKLHEELEALQDRRRGLEDRVAVARLQLEFLAALGRDVPRVVEGKDNEVRLVDPEVWRKTFALLGEGSGKAYEQTRAAEIEKRAVEKKIAQTKKRLGQARTGHTASVAARINLEAAAPTIARLELSYQLPGASWHPLYEARLDTDAGKARLIQIGQVRQGTGEDWSNVRLTLSTARPAEGARLPELAAWFIDFQRPVLAKRRRDLARSDYRDLKENFAPVVAGELRAEPSKMLADTVAAQVVAGEFAAEYRIAGAASVPSDKASHTFVISERSFPAKIAVRAVPKIAPRAYLTGEITYDGAEPLLPGPVALFRDGAFVGTGGIAMLRPGEDVKLSFGVDDKVRVTYRLETGEQSREGLFDKHKRFERRYHIEIANHHGRAMEITVLDQLPVPQNENIEAALLRTTTEPTERDFDDHKGVLAWTYTYEPNQERTIKFGYVVTHPENQPVSGF